MYGASNLKNAEAEFEKFKQTWSKYPGAIDVWVRNRAHVEQLFNYGSAVRKAMYTTNAVESVNAKKVVKQNLDDYDTKRKAGIGND
ncbi:MAG: transposase [Lachnospiraceae bacterium]|nr:transposase [Lachnospiraceae bacterium]MCR4802280.1 transposase [Lachnospiraceae bacterium]